MFGVFQSIERVAAYVQGKGYGTAKIRREVSSVQRFLQREPRLAVDVGANVGEYTAELRRWNPMLAIHAFEPSRVNVSKLVKRFGGDGLIHVESVGISDTTGSGVLYADRLGSGLGSLIKRDIAHFDMRFDASEVVSLVRFEDYWRTRLECGHVDVLKLDVEGHELSALHGCGEALESIGVVQFEFGGCNIDSRTFFRDFWTFFAEWGFVLYRIAPLGVVRIPRYREADEFFSTTNYLAVNQRGAGCLGSR
jgi:FkbM family methyltransferase